VEWQPCYRESKTPSQVTGLRFRVNCYSVYFTFLSSYPPSTSECTALFTPITPFTPTPPNQNQNHIQSCQSPTTHLHSFPRPLAFPYNATSTTRDKDRKGRSQQKGSHPTPDIESNNEQTRLVTVTDRQVDFKVHTSTDLFVALSTVGKSNSNFLDWHRKASRGRSEAIGVLCTSFIFKVYSLMTAGACSCHPIVAPSLLLHPPRAYNTPYTSQSHHLNIPQCCQHDF
jgi:hypothetical protein